MKKIITLLMLVSAFSLLLTADLEARGGRGGGRGGGRAGGRSMHRSPSMSRSSRPTHKKAARRPSTSRRPKARPSPKVQPRTARPSARPSRPTTGRGFAGGKTPTRSNVQQFLQQSSRPGDRMGRAGEPSTLPGREKFDKFKQDRPQRENRRREAGRNIRDNIGDQFPDRGDWFNDNFFDRHNYDPGYNFGDGNAWKWATWGAMNRWAGWGWGYPSSYDYGYYDDTYTDDSYAYPEEDTTYTPQDYTQQVQDIATTTQDQQESDWMSLGVFAFARDKEAIGTPNVYMQLALNKEGNLAGTIYHTTTDKTYPLEGVVDNETQRAAWMMADSENAPILETGIYNLTKDETPVRITFADGSTQNGLMVRLQKPQG